MTKNNYLPLYRKIGYTFRDPSLLTQSLTHRSAASENNERLEFLGDSILNFTAAKALFDKFPQAREGDLSRLRAALVKGETLAEIARELALGDYLVLGEGELKSGGFRRASILADAVEAIFGAIYTESGIDEAQQCVLRLYQTRIEKISLEGSGKDPKSALQEWLQARKLELPTYTLENVDGESHCQSFTVSCSTSATEQKTQATASNRRQAEKLAAKEMLKLLVEA